MVSAATVAAWELAMQVTQLVPFQACEQHLAALEEADPVRMQPRMEAGRQKYTPLCMRFLMANLSRTSRNKPLLYLLI